MSYWGWRPYVSVAERKKQAAQTAAKMVKKGQKVFPIHIEGKQLAKTFWGKAWCDHLESLGDYENRLPRGRTYVRNGSVIHLAIATGKIEALVQGSSLYKIQIEISAVDKSKWKSISQKCSGEIGSVIELLQGKMSSAVMRTMTDKKNGLFPLSKEIKLSCSCPDWAQMCKHVAAVLYGVGARLDNEPELLFTLRRADHLELISKAAVRTKTKGSGKARLIQDQELSNLFGIDLETDIKPPKGAIKSKAKSKSKTQAKSKLKSAKPKLKTKSRKG